MAGKAKTVVLNVDGEIKQVVTEKKTLDELLEEEDFIPIGVERNEKLEENKAYEVQLKKNVEFDYKGLKHNVKTYTNTVKSFLAEQEIEIEDNFVISPGLDNKLGTKVKIDEVKVYKETETTSIPYNKTEEKSSKLYKGQKEVKAGQVGQEVKQYEITEVNGERTDKKLVDTKITAPKDEITYIGTKEKVSSSAKYSIRDLEFSGVINWAGYKFTYYSQSV